MSTPITLMNCPEPSVSLVLDLARNSSYNALCLLVKGVRSAIPPELQWAQASRGLEFLQSFSGLKGSGGVCSRASVSLLLDLVRKPSCLKEFIKLLDCGFKFCQNLKY